jgi:hypothetical protein
MLVRTVGKLAGSLRRKAQGPFGLFSFPENLYMSKVNEKPALLHQEILQILWLPESSTAGA